MSKVKTILITTLALTLICVFFTAALAVTNEITAEKIAEVQKEAEMQAMTRVLPADNYVVGTVQVADADYYAAMDANGTVLGHIFTTSANGYGGEVKVMTGIAPDGKIIAIEVIDAADETPGLGQNATKKTFWEQFKGKSGQLSVVKSGVGENDIQALTGATITSNAVKDAVNKALTAHKLIKGEAENNG